MSHSKYVWGNWSAFLLFSEIVCDTLDWGFPNGTFVPAGCVTSQHLPFMSTCFPVCDDGYELRNPLGATKVCQSNKKWTNADVMPLCEGKDIGEGGGDEYIYAGRVIASWSFVHRFCKERCLWLSLCGCFCNGACFFLHLNKTQDCIQ